jgi:gliding motility-associated-like protein
VNPKPKLTSASALEICSEKNATLTLVADVTSSYTWIAENNPHISGATIALQNTRTIGNTLTNDTTSVQIVTYTATATSTIGSCLGDQQIILVTVDPKPKMTSIDSVVICSGIALNIPLLSNVASAYSWVAANNAHTNGESTSAQATTTINNTITNDTLTAQTVIYSVTPTATIGSCIGTVQTIKAKVNPNPNMTSVNAKLICGDGTPPNIALTSDITSTYSWLTTDNTTLTGETITPKIYDTINDPIVNTTINMEMLTYTVTPTSTGGSCVGIPQEVTITVAQPIAAFSNTPDNGTPPLLINFTNSSQNANTYKWIYGDGATDTTSDPGHTYNAPSVYTVKLIATNNHLCPDTATTTLIVYKLVVSNVFTPNGDGNNDFFEINHTGITSFDIEIYDRWGVKLFEGHTPDSKWDGHNSNGKTADDGTYYYLVKAKGIDGQEYSEKGFLTIIR